MTCDLLWMKRDVTEELKVGKSNVTFLLKGFLKGQDFQEHLPAGYARIQIVSLRFHRRSPSLFEVRCLVFKIHSVFPRRPKRFYHCREIFGGDIVLDVVDRGEDESAAGG